MRMPSPAAPGDGMLGLAVHSLKLFAEGIYALAASPQIKMKV